MFDTVSFVTKRCLLQLLTVSVCFVYVYMPEDVIFSGLVIKEIEMKVRV